MKLIDTAARRAAETKEDEYLAMVERHKRGKRGQRGADVMAQMFGELVNAMSESNADILGDLFEGAITYGEAGQFLSPQSIAELLAAMSVDPEMRSTRDEPIYVNDPCCGTGRMLLAASNMKPHVEMVGQDIDARCARIAAINLGWRGRYGWVVCGNSLSGEAQFAYRIGSFFHESSNGLRRGVIRDIPPDQTPVPVIAEHTRRDTKDLFETEAGHRDQVGSTQPTIIEVPHWLAVLEPGLAALDSREPVELEPEQSSETGEGGGKPEKDKDQIRLKQQRLF